MEICKATFGSITVKKTNGFILDYSVNLYVLTAASGKMSDQAVLAQNDELQTEFESGDGGTYGVDVGPPRQFVHSAQCQDLPPPYCEVEGSKQQQQQQHVPGWPQSTTRGDYLMRSGHANALHQQALDQQLQQQAARQDVRVITLPSGCQVVRVHSNTGSTAKIRLAVGLGILAIKLFIIVPIIIILLS